MDSTLKPPPGSPDAARREADNLDIPDNAQSVMERSTLGLEQELPPLHYLNTDYGIKSWLLTVDHKRIAILYLVSISAFFFLGGFAALIVRLNLLTPYSTFVRPEIYNRAELLEYIKSLGTSNGGRNSAAAEPSTPGVERNENAPLASPGVERPINEPLAGATRARPGNAMREERREVGR